MDAALRAMLTDTVLVAPCTGRDAYGAPSFGTPVARKARLQKRLSTQFGPAGRQIVEDTRLFIEGSFVMQATDQITLADATTPPIQGFAPKYDQHGVLSHYEIAL